MTEAQSAEMFDQLVDLDLDAIKREDADAMFAAGASFAAYRGATGGDRETAMRRVMDAAAARLVSEIPGMDASGSDSHRTMHGN